MSEGKLVWHQVVLFALMFILTGWRLLTGSWILDVGILWWWLGGGLGFVLVFFDWLIQLGVTEPARVFEVKLKELMAGEKIKQGLVLMLSERERQDKLVMRSALFLVVWLVLAFWTRTSIANPFSRGFMLGMGTHLVFDLGWDFVKQPERLGRWFWQVKREFEKKEIEIFVWLMVVGYILVVLGL